jgi:hypothetical protein
MTTKNKTKLVNIHIDSWDGPFPLGHDLVIHERGGDPDDGYVLYGFDEVGLFDHEFNKPTYSFIPTTNEEDN